MTRDAARAAIAGKLIEAYGFEKGLEVSRVITEPILRDFLKMCESSFPGASVSEEYRTEERAACIELTGTRTGKGAEILEVKLKNS